MCPSPISLLQFFFSEEFCLLLASLNVPRVSFIPYQRPLNSSVFVGVLCGFPGTQHSPKAQRLCVLWAEPESTREPHVQSCSRRRIRVASLGFCVHVCCWTALDFHLTNLSFVACMNFCCNCISGVNMHFEESLESVFYLQESELYINRITDFQSAGNRHIDTNCWNKLREKEKANFLEKLLALGWKLRTQSLPDFFFQTPMALAASGDSWVAPLASKESSYVIFYGSLLELSVLVTHFWHDNLQQLWLFFFPGLLIKMESVRYPIFWCR